MAVFHDVCHIPGLAAPDRVLRKKLTFSLIQVVPCSDGSA